MSPDRLWRGAEVPCAISHHQDLKGTSKGDFALTGAAGQDTFSMWGAAQPGRAATPREFGAHCCAFPWFFGAGGRGEFGLCPLFALRGCQGCLCGTHSTLAAVTALSHSWQPQLPPGGSAFVPRAGQPPSAASSSAPALTPAWCR